LDRFRKPTDPATGSRLSVFITSLDGVLGKVDFTASGRRLHWVGLPLIKEQLVFANLLTQKEWASTPLFRLLVRHAMGHPRTITALQASYPALISQKHLTYWQALEIVNPELQRRNLLLKDPEIIDLKPAICGDPIELSEKLIQMKNGTYADLIRNGTLLRPTGVNIESTSKPFIPLISLLQLSL